MSIRLILVLLVAITTSGFVFAEDPNKSTAKPYLLHLNGIGGLRNIDRSLTGGIVQGGLDADYEIYDWTEGQTGLESLMNGKLHKEQSKIVADKLVAIFRENPSRRIILVGHSGGAGIAVWALEQLPDGVSIDTLVLLQPALSPEYDLTKALKRVRSSAYSFNSIHDMAVLGAGTKLFGTIDGPKTDAAGRVGFAIPDGAEQLEYSKFKQFEYDNAWTQLGNSGDHIGVMMRPFARDVIAPLLLTGELPKIEPATRPSVRVTTRPSTQPSGVSR